MIAPRRTPRLGRGALLAALALLVPASASASESQPIGRNTSRQTLKVNRAGVALVEYTERGVRRHVLRWGAVNAGVGITRFKRDNSGGWKSKKANWKRFRNACRRYDGPALNSVVASCKAPDGSYWVLQSWTRLKDEYGGVRTFRGGPTKTELHLSHWRGPIATLELRTDWGRGGYEHMFGRYVYAGRPVHGFKTDTWGNPLDGYGRTIYLDTLNGEGYPGGWARVNSFVAQKPNGNFCFLFAPKPDHPSFTGTANGWRYSGRSTSGLYKVSVLGPGVTPDLVDVPLAGPGPFDRMLSDQLDALERQIAGSPDSKCWPKG